MVEDLPQIVLVQIVNWFAKMQVIQIPAQNAKQQTIYVVLEMIHIPMILLCTGEGNLGQRSLTCNFLSALVATA